jgi:PAS domain S-box-containing protein
MGDKPINDFQTLQAENESLREQLAAAHETLRAIRANEVDAVVVGSAGSEQVFTLKGADESYRVFVEVMRQGAATIGADGTVLYCNRFFAELLRAPLEQTIGTSIYDFAQPDDEGILRALLWEALSNPLQRPVPLRTRDAGLRIPAILTAAPLTVGDLRCVCLVVTDLSEHEALLDAESANRAKDRFIAVLSHELRTPLTPALMAVTARETDESLSAQVRDDLALVRRNLELETRLIDDLLDISRIVSGKMALRSEQVPLHALVQNVIEMLRSELQERRITVHLDLAAQHDCVIGDPTRLQQALWNLVKNAIKFSEPGRTITVRTANASDHSISVEVQDQGIGIEPAALPHIFDAFDQGELRDARQFGGLGLGLTIAKAIADAHGGTVAARSAGLGRGATFTFTLPVQPATTPLHNRGARDEVAITNGAEESRPLRVLLVEDHPDTSMVLSRLLRLVGHRVRAAGSAAEALELAAAETFDLVISDVGLPDATGYDLMRQVRQRYPIAGIAMTGYGMEDDVRKSREAGFVEHLVKPVTLKMLEQALRRVSRMLIPACTGSNANDLAQA